MSKVAALKLRRGVLNQHSRGVTPIQNYLSDDQPSWCPISQVFNKHITRGSGRRDGKLVL